MAVFDALAEGEFVAVVSPFILEELRQVLQLPKIRGRYGLSVAGGVEGYQIQRDHRGPGGHPLA